MSTIQGPVRTSDASHIRRRPPRALNGGSDHDCVYPYDGGVSRSAVTSWCWPAIHCRLRGSCPALASVTFYPFCGRLVSRHPAGRSGCATTPSSAELLLNDARERCSRLGLRSARATCACLLPAAACWSRRVDRIRAPSHCACRRGLKQGTQRGHEIWALLADACRSSSTHVPTTFGPFSAGSLTLALALDACSPALRSSCGMLGELSSAICPILRWIIKTALAWAVSLLPGRLPART